MALNQTKFNTDRVPKSLVLSAFVPRYLFSIDRYMAGIKAPLDVAVSGFFEALSGLMGTTETLDLGGLAGFNGWKPLSLEYVRRKNTAAFWIYTLAPGSSLADHSRQGLAIAKMRRLHGDKVSGRQRNLVALAKGNTLIDAVARMNGLDTLGGVEITAKPLDAALGVVYNGLKAGRKVTSSLTSDLDASVDPKPYTRTRVYYSTYQDIGGYKVTLNFRLWSKILSKELSHIESKLVESGGLSAEQARKLIGRAEYQRPLIRPFMAYYGQVYLPSIIRAAIADMNSGAGAPTSKRGGNVSSNVSISGSKFIGAL